MWRCANVPGIHFPALAAGLCAGSCDRATKLDETIVVRFVRFPTNTAYGPTYIAHSDDLLSYCFWCLTIYIFILNNFVCRCRSCIAFVVVVAVVVHYYDGGCDFLCAYVFAITAVAVVVRIDLRVTALPLTTMCCGCVCIYALHIHNVHVCRDSIHEVIARVHFTPSRI